MYVADGDDTGGDDADDDGYPAASDFDDTDPAVFPGAVEVGNGVDAALQPPTRLAGRIVTRESVPAAVRPRVRPVNF